MRDLTEDEKLRKAEELDNSELFDVHVWSEYPEVNDAVNALYDEIRKLPEFEGNEKLRKKHVKVVILDLYVKWLADPKRYSSYYRQKNRYTDLDSRYNKLHISYLTVPIVHALERLGYIENHKGHYGRTGGSSHISRMRAEKKLVDLIVKKHKITPEMVEKAPNTECIILREYVIREIKRGKRKGKKQGKQVNISYTDNEETKRMRRELYAYNNLLRRTFIDVKGFPKGGVLSKSKKKRMKINTNNLKDKFVRRVFNNNTWDDGGRFYGGWWQRLPKEWREKIVIYDVPTHEIDYSGLHIAILYALEGIDYWKDIGTDPYQIEGYEQSERMRDLLKQVLLTSINAKSKPAAVKAVDWEIITNKEEKEYEWIEDEEIDIGELIDRFAETHAPIRKYFFSNYGVKLQRIDSMMAEYVINHFTRMETPVLCVHDSFIVRSLDERTLNTSMKNAYQNVLSFLSHSEKEFKRKVSTTGLGQEFFMAMTLLDEFSYLRKKATKQDRERAKEFRNWKSSFGPDFKKRMAEFKRRDWERDYYKEFDEEI